MRFRCGFLRWVSFCEMLLEPQACARENSCARAAVKSPTRTAYGLDYFVVYMHHLC